MFAPEENTCEFYIYLSVFEGLRALGFGVLGLWAFVFTVLNTVLQRLTSRNKPRMKGSSFRE